MSGAREPRGFFNFEREASRRREHEPIQFPLQRQGCLVVPTTVPLCLLWAKGRIDDLELIYDTDTFAPTGEALLAVSLYGPQAVFSFVRQVLAWPGARAGACRTDNSAVEGWAKKFEFQFVHREPAGQWRIYGDAAALEKFRRHF